MAASASFSSSFLSSVVDDNSSMKQDLKRNTVTFNSSIWGDQFLTYDEPEDLVMEKQVVEEVKEEVRTELIIKASSNESTQHMKLIELIDVVQRLGLEYHFEKEIEEALQHIYDTYGEKWIDQNNLQNISLWFRLLRQHGFNVSLGVFKNHMDDKGSFKESLCNDAQGMLLCMKHHI
ncbi:hypothetical protein L1987_17769 [Smallanthus sonchifolius]|uniref:Uncharacterized protein n=1 Tax=Smallanthus sonchifolius TaxID=185202 RepID=A0ACB9IZV9_9ASTR|nr:hypothetical protein L1987_17769 [Smallanthus sonchifolius]